MPKRSHSAGKTIAIAARRAKIEELRRQGIMTSRQLSAALKAEGIQASHVTVQKDLAEIAAQLTKRAVDIRLDCVHEAQWRQDQLAGEWERSKRDRERRKAKKTEGSDDSGAKLEAESVTEAQTAEVGYLREHRENSQEIAKLMGAYPPHNVNVNIDLSKLTDKELEQAERLSRKLAGQ